MVVVVVVAGGVSESGGGSGSGGPRKRKIGWVEMMGGSTCVCVLRCADGGGRRRTLRAPAHLEEAARARAARVHDALRDALAVKVADLLDEVKVLLFVCLLL